MACTIRSAGKMAEKSIRGVPVSRFSHIKLLPLTNCSKSATLLGIRLSNGAIVVSPDITNYSAIKTYAELVGGEVVNVTGVWHFKPQDSDSNDEELPKLEEGTEH